MLKRPITYVSFDNEPFTEDHYFNITRAEVAKMELGKSQLSKDGNVTGGMDKYLQEQIATGEGAKIMAAFETFIDASYGVKSPDGKKHLKTPELLAEFKSSAAYDQLFYELCTDAKAGADFFNGIMPVDLKGDVEAARKPSSGAKGSLSKLTVFDEVQDLLVPEEMLDLSEEEMLTDLGAFDHMEPTPEQPGKDYSTLSATELRALPRHELLAAYKQKNRK